MIKTDSIEIINAIKMMHSGKKESDPIWIKSFNIVYTVYPIRYIEDYRLNLETEEYDFRGAHIQEMNTYGVFDWLSDGIDENTELGRAILAYRILSKSLLYKELHSP